MRYKLIRATVTRYDRAHDQLCLKLESGKRIYVPWEDFANASWFVAWFSGGKPVDLLVRGVEC